VRPEHMEPDGSGDARISGEVFVVEQLGGHTYIHVTVEGGHTLRHPHLTALQKPAHLRAREPQGVGQVHVEARPGGTGTDLEVPAQQRSRRPPRHDASVGAAARAHRLG